MTTNQLRASEVTLHYSPKVKASERIKINTSEDIYKLMKSFFDEDTIQHREFFKVLLLNNGNKVLGVYPHSIGGVVATIADTRLILQAAILANATSIVLLHSHPSGNLFPSVQDRKLTKCIKDAALLMDIKVIDHLIIGSEGYYSFCDEGLI